MGWERRRSGRRRKRDHRPNGAVDYMHCLTTMLIDYYFPPQFVFTQIHRHHHLFVVVVSCRFFFTFIMLLLYITTAMLVLLTAAEVRMRMTTILLTVNVTNH